MTARIEWRNKGRGKDTIVFVEEYGEVMKAWDADQVLLQDFLNDMKTWDTPVVRLETEMDQRDPEGWGRLVMSREQPGGQVLEVEPETYWDGIYYWFRRHGTDPHRLQRRRAS